MPRLVIVAGLILSSGCSARASPPRVFLADQGDNNGFHNRILEIHPFDHKDPPDPDGTNAIILHTLPSPAVKFLDELSLDNDGNLWCVVKNSSDQTQDGATLINKDTGAIIRRIYPFIPGHTYGSFLEGAAWDGRGLWITGVRSTGIGDPDGNVMTRVDPVTGDRIAPFTEGTLATTQMCRIPGNIAQGLLFEPGGTHGYLWHSDIGLNIIYKLDLSRLYDADPANDNNLAVAQFSVPFRPKGMAWMRGMIWIASPWNEQSGRRDKNGVWEFNPQTGATRQLFRTPYWNLDGVAIWDPVFAAGDFNEDNDVDLADFSFFQACFNGPNHTPALTECQAADTDTDGDVDLIDFATFQACFNGPDRPPGCL